MHRERHQKCRLDSRIADFRGRFPIGEVICFPILQFSTFPLKMDDFTGAFVELFVEQNQVLLPTTPPHGSLSLPEPRI